MNKMILTVCMCITGAVFTATAQSVGIGTTTPHTSAALEINSTNKGTLITTMSTTQRNDIINPATGLLVYDIDKKTIYMYDGIRWLPFLFSNTNKNPATLLNPSGLAIDDFFGYRVAIDGDYAIIGAYARNSVINADAGVAYIYHRNNGVWQQQELIYAADGEADDYFGASVSISGDYAVVGAWGDDVGADANQGSIYVFARTGSDWTQQIKLTAADGLANDFYGYSADISNTGASIIVGAYGDNIGANTNQGSAYLYTRSGNVWSFRAKLTASDGDFGDSFGNSVSINGQYAVVGAYLDDAGANTDQGSVYSFYELTEPGGWATGQAYHQKITDATGEADDFFGVSVSLSNFFLTVGISGDDVGANVNQGSAIGYFRSPIQPYSYQQPLRMTAPDGAANDNFGISVATNSTSTVIGAYRHDGADGTSNAGAVYVFNSGGIIRTLRRKIDDDAANADGYFGFAVAIAGYEIVIGAYNKNNGTGQVGFINIQ